jgi:hypothetical protein
MSKEFEEFFAPCSEFHFSCGGSFIWMCVENIERHPADERQVFRRMVLAAPGIVFEEHHVKLPMEVVFYTPMCPDDFQYPARRQYKRVTGDERTFIKGQRYVLLSRRENLSDGGRQNLERLLQANARLNVAYLLREQFEQLWSYTDPADARSFFDNWQQQLQGQDLAP